MAACYRITNSKGALLRDGPSLESDMIGVLVAGTEVEVVEKERISSKGRECIRLGAVLGGADGRFGWFSAKTATEVTRRSHGWEFQTDSGWSAYDVDDDDREVDALLEASHAVMDSAPVVFTKNRMKYAVSVLERVQTNERFKTRRRIRRRERRRPPAPRLAPVEEPPRAPTRVFAVSDCHVDFQENMDWLFGLPVGPYDRDVVVVAGDVGHTLPLLAVALTRFKLVFKEVCFCVGNHEL